MKTLFMLLLLLGGVFAYTNASCLNDNKTLRIVENYSWVINGTVYNMSWTTDKFCEGSCVGKVCVESILRSQDRPIIAIAILFMACLFGYWAYKKEWFKWGF